MPTFVLEDSQKVDLSVSGADATEAKAPFFAPVTWSSSDTSVLTVTPSADTLTATASAVAAQPTGAAPVTVTASAFADSAATVVITGTLDVSVIPTPVPAATHLVITPGTPAPK